MFKSLFRRAQITVAEHKGAGSSGVDMGRPRRKLSDLRPNRADLDPIEIASRDEIAALQRQRLAATLTLAYEKVPHYKAAFDAKGVHPADFKNLEDLRQFPFTSKADLRANYPFGMFAVPREQVARIHASSGTTGKPTVVGYTKGDVDTWAAVMARSIRASGGRPGMAVHVAYGYGLFTGGLGAHYGAERLGCTVIPVSGGMTERQVQLIVDFKPDIIMVTPSYMLAILDEFQRAGIDPRQTSLKVGIFGAEPWTNAMRAEIEEAFDIHSVDIYGLSEVIGPGVANECVETKDGLHIWEDHFYPEIVDPITGEALPDGAFGELVFTSLTKEAMPVVRYRTRDLTRLLPGTARSMRRMEKVTGRSDDMLIVRGVNMFPTQIEERLLSIPSLSGHYQIVLTRPARLDEVEVKVEVRADADSPEARAEAGAALERAIRETVGLTATVSVLSPGGIERSLGKAKRVLDLRPRDGQRS
jgi:phenylacetate-CoA ligase